MPIIQDNLNIFELVSIMSQQVTKLLLEIIMDDMKGKMIQVELDDAQSVNIVKMMYNNNFSSQVVCNNEFTDSFTVTFG